MFGAAYFGKTYFGGSYWGPGSGTPTPPVPGDVIRNFSLRNWRKWRREDDDDLPPIEEGALPENLRALADTAIAQAQSAAREQAEARVEYERRDALLRSMEARAAFEDAYRTAYGEMYIATIVAELWARDMRRAERRRKAVLLLLQ